MKFGILVFPGSNCDRDVASVTSGILKQPTRLIWHTDTDISDCDVIVVPGDLAMVIICAVGRSPDLHP